MFKEILIDFGINSYFEVVETCHTRVCYGEIAGELERQGLDAEKPHDIAKVVISIRQSKLPDPDIILSVILF